MNWVLLLKPSVMLNAVHSNTYLERPLCSRET